MTIGTTVHLNTPIDEIPNRELIRAVLDGKTVQWRSKVLRVGGKWDDVSARDAIVYLAEASPSLEFRLKPEPVVFWGYVEMDKQGRRDAKICRDELAARAEYRSYPGIRSVLRIEVDPENFSVINARMEAP